MKTGTVVLTAAALFGVGVGSAFADAPSQVNGSDPSQNIRFFNASPYLMWVLKADGGGPPAVLDMPSGRSVTFPAGELARYGIDDTLDVVEYDQAHKIWDASTIRITGYQPGVQQCSPASGQQSSRNMGCLVQTPDPSYGETGPTQISIYTTNPEHAGESTSIDANDGNQAAIGNFLAGLATMSKTSINFDPDYGTASWGVGPQTQAGPAMWNCTTSPSVTQIGGPATHQESTNVAGDYFGTQGVNLLDAVDPEISWHGHKWTDVTTDTETLNWNIPAHDVGWLGSIPATESITGVVTATPALGHPITFSGVSFVEPGLNHANDPQKDYQYVPHTRAMTPEEINDNCNNDAADHNRVVARGTVEDVAAGAVTVTR